MITNLLIFLGLCIASWLIVEGAEPIQWIKHYLKIDDDAEYLNDFQWFFKKLFNCFLCTGFWIGICFYWSFPIACIVSLMSEIGGRLINKILK